MKTIKINIDIFPINNIIVYKLKKSNFKRYFEFD